MFLAKLFQAQKVAALAEMMWRILDASEDYRF
jgi:hypothetical protein